MTSLEEALARIAALEQRLATLERASGLFADDRELDRPRAGDPMVKFDAKQWRGASHKGRHFSECDPAFLDVYAEALQYMADHPKEGKDPKYARYDRLDAARARSWARRLRAGWKRPRVHLAADAPEFPGDPMPGAGAPPAGPPPGLFDDGPNYDGPPDLGPPPEYGQAPAPDVFDDFDVADDDLAF